MIHMMGRLRSRAVEKPTCHATLGTGYRHCTDFYANCRMPTKWGSVVPLARKRVCPFRNINIGQFLFFNFLLSVCQTVDAAKESIILSCERYEGNPPNKASSLELPFVGSCYNKLILEINYRFKNLINLFISIDQMDRHNCTPGVQYENGSIQCFNQ